MELSEISYITTNSRDRSSREEYQKLQHWIKEQAVGIRQNEWGDCSGWTFFLNGKTEIGWEQEIKGGERIRVKVKKWATFAEGADYVDEEYTFSFSQKLSEDLIKAGIINHPGLPQTRFNSQKRLVYWE